MGLVLPPSLGRAGPLDARGREVMALRLAVDELSAEVRAEREALSRARERLEGEALELELALGRARARLKAARKEEAEARLAAERASEASTALVPPLLDTIQRLEGQIRAGLPFRVEARLEALAKIRSGLKSAQPSSEEGAVRLWRFVREELRLSETTGLGREVLKVRGERQLAEVARLGMVTLLFRLPGGQVGYLRPLRGGGHRLVVTASLEEQEAIASIFAYLSRGRAGGKLSVPANSLVEAPR